MPDYDGAANVEDGMTESHMTGSEGPGMRKHVIAELRRRAAQSDREEKPKNDILIQVQGNFTEQPFEFPKDTQAEFQPTHAQELAAGLVGVSAYLASQPLIDGLTSEATQALYAARAGNDDWDPTLRNDEAVA